MKAYQKSIVREILSSKARFFSIMLIIFLGVAFYSGIKSAGPDMNKTINKFYNNENLMDSKIISTLGLSDKDLELIKNDPNILDYYGTHSIDANLTNMSNVVKFMEYNVKNNINNLVVLEGKLPEKSGEIALDERAFKLNKNLKIGDYFTIDADENTMKNFKENKFKIVGIVKSPMYIEKESRGSTTVGKGIIDYFGVLNIEDINMGAYTEIYVRFKNVQGLNAYGDEYKELMEENNKYLEDLYSNRKIERVEEIKWEAKKEFNKAYEKLNENEKLAEGRKEIEEKEKSTLNDFNECNYYVFDRTDNPGYSGYNDSINSLDSIASVLPVFFFIVSVLICLTTITRMVEEKRIEIGTMKALGYGDFEISLKFVIYAALASIIGCLLGILVGSNILPNIISNAYTSLYDLPNIDTYYYSSYIIQALAISILCTVGAASFVVRVELKNKPANLMRPKAPKLGKKILLERITPIWEKLNFNQKVTFRNIFRYKQRMLMTIFGIAGCMALLVTGFGLKDSNTGMVEKQFDKLWNYETMVVFGDNHTELEIQKYNEILKELPGYENNLRMHQESVTFSKEGMNKQTVSLYVPQNKDELDKFIVLNDRILGKKYEIPDEGVVINEKLGKLLGVSIGDIITFKNENNNTYDVEVKEIAENYIMHSIYMSPSYYEKVFGKKANYNTDLINFDKNKINEDEISSKLMECKNVVNVTMTSQIEKTTKESAANMNVVMLVIILSAGSLAFVVLYNLNNINVSERIRELSTIKVLGFFDDEVTMYILRENIILTLLGILAGASLGKILHAFIIKTSETDTMMMYPNINITSYIFSALITILFTVIVMILMHVKLRKVNMIDALKSNE
ncbi:ABC transporter permease [Clostridium sp.]|uniref:FtsX-like permease family protein n=1 Tax=Clostridium sp. TaxID=1506 RepID=UPI00261CB956